MSEDTSPESRGATRDFILEWTKGGPDRARREMDTLDDKATKIFSAAGVVIGLAGLASFDASKSTDLAVAFLVAALVAFGLVALLTILQLAPTQYDAYEHADVLWKLYANFPGWGRQGQAR